MASAAHSVNRATPRRFTLRDECAHADIIRMPDRSLTRTQYPATSGTGAWAQVYVEGVGDLHGQVVGFDAHMAVVAVARAIEIPAGRAAIISIGVDSADAHGIHGTTAANVVLDDGRTGVGIALDESIGAPASNSAGHNASDRRQGAPQRRAKARIAFTARVDAMAISSRKSSDTSYRCDAYDLSTRGMGAYCNRELVRGTNVLLRFPVPPHRGGVVQVRATVAHLRRITDSQFQLGFEFERMGSSQLGQLANAVTHLEKAAARLLDS